MDFTNLIGGGLQLGGGIWAGLDSLSMGGELANIADPFRQYRGQFGQQLASSQTGDGSAQNLMRQGGQQAGTYASMLQNLAQNPGSIYSDPTYQAAFSQGTEAINRSLAASGMNLSGNQLTALQNYGMTQGANFYNQRLQQLSGLQNNALGMNQQGFSQLAGLSGLSQANPGAAALALSNARNQAGQGFQSAGQGLGQLLGGNTPSNISSLVRNIGNLFGGSVDLTSLGSMFGGSGIFGGSAGGVIGSADSLGGMLGTGSFLPGIGDSAGAFSGIFGSGAGFDAGGLLSSGGSLFGDLGSFL